MEVLYIYIFFNFSHTHACMILLFIHQPITFSFYVKRFELNYLWYIILCIVIIIIVMYVFIQLYSIVIHGIDDILLH